MSLGDVLGVYAPLLAYAGLPMVVLIVILLLPGKTLSIPTILGFVGVMALGGFLLTTGIVTSAKGALEKGILTTGEVVSASGMTARMKTSVRGRDIEVALTSRYAGSLRVGDRHNILVDPEKEKLLLALGPATS